MDTPLLFVNTDLEPRPIVTYKQKRGTNLNIMHVFGLLHVLCIIIYFEEGYIEMNQIRYSNITSGGVVTSTTSSPKEATARTKKPSGLSIEVKPYLAASAASPCIHPGTGRWQIAGKNPLFKCRIRFELLVPCTDEGFKNHTLSHQKVQKNITIHNHQVITAYHTRAGLCLAASWSLPRMGKHSPQPQIYSQLIQSNSET